MKSRDPQKPSASLVLQDAAVLLTCTPIGQDLAGRLFRHSVAIGGETILAIAPFDELAAQVDLSTAPTLDARGKIVAPGFVDSHTHLVFGGSRAQEYAARMTRTAAEVREMDIPTGIQASVQMTRAASKPELLASAKLRLDAMLAHGTTTVESKSGYGLSLDQEIKQLEVNRTLGTETPVDIISTFLGAHAVPPEMSRERYVNLLIQEMVPAVAESNLAEFCDVYCDEGYFTVHDSRRILEAGHRAGLGLKIHTDQYSALGGSDLAADLEVVSADHLNYTERPTMDRLAKAGVVGVLMPAIDFAVQHPHAFDARAMMDAGMTVALATDLCPGGWTESMQLVLQMACRLHQFTPEEALVAGTLGGAQALGLPDRGAVRPGLLADLQIWDLPSLEDLIYRLGSNAVETVIKRGQVVLDRKNLGLY